MAKQELQQGWQGKAGPSVASTIKKEKAIKHDGFRLGQNSVQATTEAGILYGVFELLRRQQTGVTLPAGGSTLSYEPRGLNH